MKWAFCFGLFFLHFGGKKVSRIEEFENINNLLIAGDLMAACTIIALVVLMNLKQSFANSGADEMISKDFHFFTHCISEASATVLCSGAHRLMKSSETAGKNNESRNGENA